MRSSSGTDNWSFWRFARESWHNTKGRNRVWFLWKLWGSWRLFDDMQNNRY